MAEDERVYYTLPVIAGKAWAFDDFMRFEAWGTYVRSNPEHFTTDFLMRCATLPPQAAEALDVARRTVGDMNFDTITFIKRMTDEAGFVKNDHSCPKDCVCPGSFQSVSLTSLPVSVQKELSLAATRMSKAVGERVWFVPL